MSRQKIDVNRTLVGGIALTCLAIALGLLVWDSWENVWCGAFMRVGLVLGAFWLALPTGNREAAWANVSPYALLGVLLAALIFVRRPLVFLPLLAVLTAVGLFLRPRARRR